MTAAEVGGADEGVVVNITKKEMVRRIAAELQVDQALTRRIVQRTLDSILEALASVGRIELRDFGVFEVKHRAARKARNPKTNQQVVVPAKSVLVFQPGKNVAAMVERASKQAPSRAASVKPKPAAPASPPPPAQNA